MPPEFAADRERLIALDARGDRLNDRLNTVLGAVGTRSEASEAQTEQDVVRAVRGTVAAGRAGRELRTRVSVAARVGDSRARAFADRLREITRRARSATERLDDRGERAYARSIDRFADLDPPEGVELQHGEMLEAMRRSSAATRRFTREFLALRAEPAVRAARGMVVALHAMGDAYRDLYEAFQGE